MFDLNGKSAVVTGAAQGIGEAIVRALADLGARVAVADLQEDRARAVADSIVEAGGRALGVRVDVNGGAGLRAAMASIADAHDGIDIIVNSAGVLGTTSIEEMERTGEWNRVLDINLSGTFFASQAALPYLKESGAGRIINISSLTGRNGGFEGAMSYAAAKGGVNSITRGMARHLAQHRITVNAVCPATTRTAILDGYSPERIENQARHILLGRLGEPSEIAAAVCYLASDEAAFTTGVLLDVNGGAYFG
ncbi:SDR family oxidoreductase [Actinomyces sp. B33]|uniref:SDR family NAD(P)-dependent oxidoreductase n=1 Tax=Actinomyces sp. B33 TaxID=2942131 RepID=UPI00233FAC13|nr:SDR family NAD(P)-dependent oxidoreductase [Actinomyces sp. B33]MDC4232477.1 SDR family oxidoreductase [Actinomyces sp. B33]